MSDANATPRCDDPHVLVGIDNVRQFVTAGHAIFTMKNTETGNRVTYKVIGEKGSDRKLTGKYRVFAFTGSDNSKREHYSDLGVIDNGRFQVNDLIAATEAMLERAKAEKNETARKFAADTLHYLREGTVAQWRLTRLATALTNWNIPVTTLAVSDMKAKVFPWLWSYINAARDLPVQVEVWHEGRCGHCGRRLTVPESIADGLGPRCKVFSRST